MQSLNPNPRSHAMPSLNLDAIHAYTTRDDLTPEVKAIARTMGAEVTMEVFLPVSRPGERYEQL